MPSSCSMTRITPSSPSYRSPPTGPTPCTPIRNVWYSLNSTGLVSARALASDLARMRRNTSLCSHAFPPSSAAMPSRISPRALSMSKACTAPAASIDRSVIIRSTVKGPCVLAYLATRPSMSSSGSSFQNVLRPSSSSTSCTARGSMIAEKSACPSSRSSTSGSIDSSCADRSA